MKRADCLGALYPELGDRLVVTIHGDERVELDESFRVRLSNLLPSNPDVILNRAIGVATLQNDDTSQVRVVGVAAVEGDTATTALNFAVSLTRPILFAPGHPPEAQLRCCAYTMLGSG